MQLLKWAPLFDILQETHLTITYPGFSWVQPVSPDKGRLLHVVGVLAALSLLLGLATRASTIICFAVFGYLFALDVSAYSNHLVLMCHVLLTACFLDWGNWGSLDRFISERRSGRATPTCVPYWHLLALQLLAVIPYIFGAVAKLNADWILRAQPLRLYYEAHVSFTNLDSLPFFASWLRLAFDVALPVLLFWEPSRYAVAFPACAMYHINLKIVFGAGGSPLLMIIALCLFAPPHGPDHLMRLLLNRASPGHAARLKTSRSLLPDRDTLHDALREYAESQIAPEDGVIASTGLQQAGTAGGHRRVPSSVNVNLQSSWHGSLENNSAAQWTLDDALSASSHGIAAAAPERESAHDGRSGRHPPERAHAKDAWGSLPDEPRAPDLRAEPPDKGKASIRLWVERGEASGGRRGALRLRLLWTLFAAFHVLWPLRHFLLYRGSPSWHEAGHLGSWRTGIRTKRGWTYLIAEGVDGKLHEFAPAFDNFILRSQRAKLTLWPHSLLQYADRMRDIFQAAGVPLKSIRAHSCISVNGHDARMLFNPDEDLLRHIGRYELVGTSGVGSLIYDWHAAPLCPLDGGYRANLSLRRRMVKTLSRVYGGASIREAPPAPLAEGEDDESYGFQVVHIDDSGAQQLAYLWRPRTRKVWKLGGGAPLDAVTHRVTATRHRHVDLDVDSSGDDDYFSAWEA